jgi:hypothetical protein
MLWRRSTVNDTLNALAWEDRAIQRALLDMVAVERRASVVGRIQVAGASPRRLDVLALFSRLR